MAQQFKNTCCSSREDLVRLAAPTWLNKTIFIPVPGDLMPFWPLWTLNTNDAEIYTGRTPILHLKQEDPGLFPRTHSRWLTAGSITETPQFKSCAPHWAVRRPILDIIHLKY